MYQYGATFVQNVRRVSRGTVFGPILFFIYTAGFCNGRVYILRLESPVEYLIVPDNHYISSRMRKR